MFKQQIKLTPEQVASALELYLKEHLGIQAHVVDADLKMDRNTVNQINADLDYIPH